MTTTIKSPIETCEPRTCDREKFFDDLMERISAMTPEEFVQYQIKNGTRHPDGTLKWPEGEPVGMPYPGDYDV